MARSITELLCVVVFVMYVGEPVFRITNSLSLTTSSRILPRVEVEESFQVWLWALRSPTTIDLLSFSGNSFKSCALLTTTGGGCIYTFISLILPWSVIISTLDFLRRGFGPVAVGYG